jgi:hypothetical protein
VTFCPLARQRIIAVLTLLLTCVPALADGIVVDRVYDPYVQPFETEIEWRSIVQQDDDANDLEQHMLGVGHALTNRWFGEIYAVGTRARDESINLDVYELELKWQLTEQGEYAADWGAAFELEREVDDDIWEASATLLLARDFSRWTTLVNLGVILEWGSGLDRSEVETVFRTQARYRLRPSLEPAMELHIGQDTAVLGPAFTGLYRFAPGRKMRWEAGLFFAIDENSPDRVFKLNLEYEF